MVLVRSAFVLEVGVTLLGSTIWFWGLVGINGDEERNCCWDLTDFGETDLGWRCDLIDVNGTRARKSTCRRRKGRLNRLI